MDTSHGFIFFFRGLLCCSWGDARWCFEDLTSLYGRYLCVLEILKYKGNRLFAFTPTRGNQGNDWKES